MDYSDRDIMLNIFLIINCPMKRAQRVDPVNVSMVGRWGGVYM